MHHAENCTPEEKEILLAFLTTNNKATTATTVTNIVKQEFTVAILLKNLEDKHNLFARKNIKRLQKQKKRMLVSL